MLSRFGAARGETLVVFRKIQDDFAQDRGINILRSARKLFLPFMYHIIRDNDEYFIIMMNCIITMMNSFIGFLNTPILTNE